MSHGLDPAGHFLIVLTRLRVRLFLPWWSAARNRSTDCFLLFRFPRLAPVNIARYPGLLDAGAAAASRRHCPECWVLLPEATAQERYEPMSYSVELRSSLYCATTSTYGTGKFGGEGLCCATNQDLRNASPMKVRCLLPRGREGGWISYQASNIHPLAHLPLAEDTSKPAIIKSPII